MDSASQEHSDTPVRVRFAPSPTGHLHLGGARTALYNWLFARGRGGTFILRIEDTDVERSEEIYTRQILADMSWLGLDWDEGPEKGGAFGPYFQSMRGDRYKQYCARLLDSGMAYRCFCSAEELDERRKEAEQAKAVYGYDGRCRTLDPQEVRRRLDAGEPAAIRFRVPDEGYTVFKDMIRKKVSVKNSELDDFIIVRSDGTPTYNFTVVADDLDMKITHVIRGDDHISNTPKQILIYQGLGQAPPVYAHIPMILGPDGQRLSKRHGATAIFAYRDMGYLPEAMVNYLALLGWAFDDKQTLFTGDELIRKFSLEGVSKKAAIFDNQKLLWMNGVYLRDLPMDRLAGLCLPILKSEYAEKLPRIPRVPDSRAAGSNPLSDVHPEEHIDEERVRKVLGLVQPRMKSLNDVVDLTAYFWEDAIRYTPEAEAQLTGEPAVADYLRALHKRLGMVKLFTHEELERLCGDLVSELGIKFGVLAHPLRAAVTGRTASPGIFETLSLIGKERVMERLDKAIRFIEEKRIKQ